MSSAPPIILLVFAHPDDHLLVAGTIFKYRAQGYNVHEIVCTGGENGVIGGQKNTQDKTKQIRLAEHQAAATLLGLSSTIYLDKRDGFVYYDDQIVLQLAHQIRTLLPQIVITHTLVDMHPDHETVAAMTRQAVKLAHLSVDLHVDEKRWRVPMLWYVQCYLTAEHHILIDTSEFTSQKQTVVQTYPSQHNPKLVKSMCVIDHRNALVLPNTDSAEGYQTDPSWPLQL